MGWVRVLEMGCCKPVEDCSYIPSIGSCQKFRFSRRLIILSFYLSPFLMVYNLQHHELRVYGVATFMAEFQNILKVYWGKHTASNGPLRCQIRRVGMRGQGCNLDGILELLRVDGGRHLEIFLS